MSKLFKLKRWLTLAEAANHLTQLFGETVTEADVLRLALDGKLKLSVVFVGHVLASWCKPVEDAEIEFREVPTFDGTGVLRLPVGGHITYAANGQTLQCQKKVFQLESDEPYELTMMGGERGDVEYKYWKLAGGPQVETIDLDGTYVADHERTYSILSLMPGRKQLGAEAHPAGGLPDDAVMVVTPTALLDFEKSIEIGAGKADKPLTTRERDTLLTIIAVLCKEAKLDRTKHAKTAGLIHSTAVQMGVSIGESTIEGHLKKIPDALGTRMK